MLQKVKLFLSRLKKQKTCLKQEKQSSKRTNFCKICFNKIEDNSIHSLINQKLTICHHCFNKFKPVFINFKHGEIKCLALYNYDEIIQEKLYQFKGCFDFELGSIFLEYFYPYLRHKFFGYILVPAPSFEDKNIERGYNHVEVMFSCLNMRMEKCIKKIANIKQTNLNAKERENIGQNFKIENGEKLFNKKVLIVDDVYTTGSTVDAMIKLIKPHHPKIIKVLVMSKTVSIFERIK